MSKEIDLIKNIINEVDDNLYSVYGNAPQLLITDKLRDLLFRLDTPEVRDFFENYNQQDQRIAELEEQLKNAIVPKFKIGQCVYTIRHNNYVYDTRIDEIKIVGINGKNEIFYYYDQPGSYAHWEEVEDNLFATKEEALAKLEELQGE